jgi:hypothetical protein
MNRGQLIFGDLDQLGHSFGTLVDCKMRERLQHERQLAEHRMTKHRLEAKKSCAPNAASYRIVLHQFKRWLRAIPQ